ncbi:Beta-catenin-like protein 1-like protein [Colletotrichum siamense]|uniref:Beta-catenin-like protein 1-like protein n=1 Tax=Colletotrichum siamense TaxID=690259 RepID=A0A9P5BKL9_COLSI|nr:Beta-catenin-like protein 1-like protein [Colletotrichum siamense]KAI8227432.1 Beta-catenin-like protein 1-like protein [Colletotrichum sp. SAR 10_96]KAI8250850.1 Beta-catenin-like protein 1-like protein [Colletotrichum sp. SAR11_239]KAI8258249.1 Beta-catenin-like protein 1-like protein [Colletotrichum sp. SAR 10_98]KAJ5008768.1 Beta-catenin-like protein 1-like protein [Colletotrichum sp. SAR 10_99]
MTDVDNLFKSSGGVGKRKLDAVRDPNEIYKSAKLSASESISRHAQVEEEGDDDDIAGPAPPPDDDADDYGPEMPPDEDDEGRFFGGGITKQESEILDYVDGRGENSATSEKIDAAWVRKAALNFEKRITKNAELRAKFANEPQKFIESEADLDAAIKDLSILAEHPDLYPQFVKLGCVDSLAGLLTHENTDIAIDAVEIIGELTDEDVYASDDDWDMLVDALLKADLVSLLVSNFSRLNEDDESDRSGVYHALGVLENLLSKKTNAETVGRDETLIRWLLERAQRKESPVSQNKQYATELLDIIAHTSTITRRRLAELDAVDVLLQLVSAYRKRDPEKGGEEEEYMENLFNALVCIVDEPEGKFKFLEAEGIELCLIMLKEGKMSKQPSMRLLVHSVSGDMSGEVCRKIVEAGGLKILFTLFKKTTQQRMVMESLFDIFRSLLRFLPANSAERIRTLAKFVEREYEKLDRLYDCRRTYKSMLDVADQEIQKERSRMSADDAELSEGEWFLKRIDEGLYSVWAIDVILAWLAAEDAGAKRRIQKLLGKDGQDLAAVRATLQEYREDLDLEKPQHKDLAEMLTTLMDFLQ